MSQLGQKAKYSLRANNVCCGRENGHGATTAACPYRRRHVRTHLFHLYLNGGSVGIGGTGKDHEVATRDIVLAAHQLADWSDCINDGCARGVGHEALQWF